MVAVIAGQLQSGILFIADTASGSTLTTLKWVQANRASAFRVVHLRQHVLPIEKSISGFASSPTNLQRRSKILVPVGRKNCSHCTN